MIPYLGEVYCPTSLELQLRGLDAGDLRQFKDFNIGYEVTPEDYAVATQENHGNLSVVGVEINGMLLWAILEGCKDYVSIPADFYALLQATVVPYAFV